MLLICAKMFLLFFFIHFCNQKCFFTRIRYYICKNKFSCYRFILFLFLYSFLLFFLLFILWRTTIHRFFYLFCIYSIDRTRAEAIEMIKQLVFFLAAVFLLYYRKNWQNKKRFQIKSNTTSDKRKNTFEL